MAAAALIKARSTDTDKLITAAEGIEAPSPFGLLKFRAADHQSTLGVFFDRTAMVDGKGVMVDFSYKSGADYLLGEAEAKAPRPAE